MNLPDAVDAELATIRVVADEGAAK
jgi:hypothetical protein